MDAHETPDSDPRELRAAAAIHNAAAAVRAPDRLRARIEADRRRATPRGRRRTVYGIGLAGAVAVVALALVLLLPAGTPGAPSVSEAAALAVRGSAAAAPSSDPQAPDARLDQRVGVLYFPNWSWRFGWTAVGQRSDVLSGRKMLTVFYQGHQSTIAYTIVSGSVLARPDGSVRHLGRLELRLLSVDGRLLVSWRRDGHTCLLSGMGVTATQLERLAAWDDAGSPR